MGHPSAARTLASIQINYYWYGMNENIESYVQSCDYCRRYKHNNRVAAVPIQPYGAPSAPFEVVHIDLTGANLPSTTTGNKYILVLKCSLTRYVEIYAIPNKSEITIAQILVDKIYHRHGAPAWMISDQGTEFVNEVIKQVTLLLGMNRSTTTAGNPRSNGLVENHNRILKTMLAQYVNAYQSDWDKYLSLCAYQYNTTVNSQTGFTPFFMIYGREARQLCDQWIHTYAKDIESNKVLKDHQFKYIAKLIQVLDNSWTIAGNRKP
jgi:transposase InsO family protein